MQISDNKPSRWRGSASDRRKDKNLLISCAPVIIRPRERNADMGPADFRRIALALNAATGDAHMGHPDFRVSGRIFASLNHDETRGMVALTREQQETFLREHPSTFQPESGAWGRAGHTRVLFETLDQEVLGEALTLAWQNAMRKGTARRAPGRQPAAGSPSRRRPPERRSRS